MLTQSTPLIRVVIVDDHAVFRTGLCLVIGNQPGLTVVAQAANCAEALSVVAHESPDVILLDLDLGDDSGLELLPALLAASNARVLLLTGLRDPEIHRRAVALGAMGLVLKDQAAETIIKAIAKVHAGEVWLDRSMIASVLSEMTRAQEVGKVDPEAAKIATLTAREREVIVLIGEGLKNKQIADRLSISETTVRHHLTSIFHKLDLSDRLELVIYAYRHNLAHSPR